MGQLDKHTKSSSGLQSRQWHTASKLCRHEELEKHGPELQPTDWIIAICLGRTQVDAKQLIPRCGRQPHAQHHTTILVALHIRQDYSQ
jgi:hypothetical protein